jgi:hypothetical protein
LTGFAASSRPGSYRYWVDLYGLDTNRPDVQQVDWNGGPDAPRYREMYTALANIQARFPALHKGSLVAIKSNEDRVAAFARRLPGEQTVLTVINFSSSRLEAKPMSRGCWQCQKTRSARHRKDDRRRRSKRSV